MATLVLEDFSGQASVTVFPATYAKFHELLSRDSVVKITGVVMHRERPGNGGEKTIEVRLEDISPLEPAFDFNARSNPDYAGTVLIKVYKATKAEMEGLKEVLVQHRGDYEVQLQVMPPEDHAPAFLSFTVETSPIFRQAIERALTHAKVEVFANEWHAGIREPIADAV